LRPPKNVGAVGDGSPNIVWLSRLLTTRRVPAPRSWTSSEGVGSIRVRTLDVGEGILNIDGPVAVEATVVYEASGLHYGALGRAAVDLEELSADGRTGTAVLTQAGGVIFNWTCR